MTTVRMEVAMEGKALSVRERHLSTEVPLAPPGRVRAQQIVELLGSPGGMHECVCMC